MTELIKEQIGQITPGSRQYFVADGTWSLFELIEYIISQIGPSHMHLTSFSISEDSIRSLLHLKQTGAIKTLEGLFDHSLRKTKSPLLYFADEVFDNMGIIANHSKIVLFHSHKYQVSLLASANLGRNRRLEAGVIETDPLVYQFFLNAFTQACDQAQPV